MSLRSAIVTATIALALTALPALTLGATAGAQPAGEPLRVALVPVGVDRGMDPDLGARVEAALRDAADDAGVALVGVSPRSGEDGGFCDEACLAGLAEPVGAAYVLVGDVYRADDGGYEVAFELRAAGVPAPVDAATATAADPEALLDRATDAARALFDRAHGAEPPAEMEVEVEPEPLPAPVVRRARRPRPVRIRPDAPYRAYGPSPYDTKSPGLAVALEILFPSAGLIYTESYLEAGLEWTGLVVGVLMVVNGASRYDGYGYPTDDGAESQVVLGALILIASRIYGIVAAPLDATAYNRAARAAWEARERSATWAAPPRGLELGETALSPPPMTALTLPAVTF